MPDVSWQTRRTRAFPVLLVGLSVLMLIAMSHHPVVTRSTPSDAFVQMLALGSLDRIVHGALIALIGGVFLLFVEFSAFLGFYQPLVRSAAALYSLGVCAMFGAALLDGFALPALVENYARSPSIDYVDFSHTAQLIVRIGVLPLTGLAAVLMAVGQLGWVYVIWRSARWVGFIGIATALVPIIGLFSGWLSLDKQGAMLVLVSQCCWNVAVGIYWYRRRTA
jgi:hypothetical protein